MTKLAVIACAAALAAATAVSAQESTAPVAVTQGVTDGSLATAPTLTAAAIVVGGALIVDNSSSSTTTDGAGQ